MPRKPSGLRPGARIKKIRKLNNFTQSQLADLVKLDGYFKNGNYITESKLIDVEEGLYDASGHVYTVIANSLNRSGKIRVDSKYIRDGDLSNISSFPLRLWELRTRKKMSQSDIVELANGKVSQPQIAKFENGKKFPSQESKQIIADALGVHLYLLTHQKEDGEHSPSDMEVSVINVTNSGVLKLSEHLTFDLPIQLKKLFRTLPQRELELLINSLHGMECHNDGCTIKLECSITLPENFSLFDDN